MNKMPPTRTRRWEELLRRGIARQETQEPQTPDAWDAIRERTENALLPKSLLRPSQPKNRQADR